MKRDDALEIRETSERAWTSSDERSIIPTSYKSSQLPTTILTLLILSNQINHHFPIPFPPMHRPNRLGNLINPDKHARIQNRSEQRLLRRNLICRVLIRRLIFGISF